MSTCRGASAVIPCDAAARNPRGALGALAGAAKVVADDNGSELTASSIRSSPSASTYSLITIVVGISTLNGMTTAAQADELPVMQVHRHKNVRVTSSPVAEDCCVHLDGSMLCSVGCLLAFICKDSCSRHASSVSSDKVALQRSWCSAFVVPIWTYCNCRYQIVEMSSNMVSCCPA
jgi:hypothetical protein